MVAMLLVMPGCVYFNGIYNTRKSYGPKSSMEKFEASSIDMNDLVLLECYVTRYH